MKKVSVGLALGVTLGACAAQKSEPKSPPATAESTAPAQQAGYPQDSAAQQYAQPPPPPEAAPVTPATPAPPADAKKPSTIAPGKAAEGPPSGRAMAVQSAARDVDKAQRELDVAAGDCQNACRALGSMDRAAGHLCDLAQDPDERRRCEEAKQKLYSARDRVRNTCGSCGPGGASVDRGAPVPSLR